MAVIGICACVDCATSAFVLILGIPILLVLILWITAYIGNSLSITLGQAAIVSNEVDMLGRDSMGRRAAAIDANIKIVIADSYSATLGSDAAGNIDIRLDRIFSVFMNITIVYPVVDSICLYTGSRSQVAFNRHATFIALGHAKGTDSPTLVSVGCRNIFLLIHGNIVEVYLATWVADSNIVDIQCQASIVLHLDGWSSLSCQAAAAIEIVSGNIDIAPRGCQIRDVDIIDKYIFYYISILIQQARFRQYLRYSLILSHIANIGCTLGSSIACTIFCTSRILAILSHQLAKLVQTLYQALCIAVATDSKFRHTNPCGLSIINLYHIAKLL